MYAHFINSLILLSYESAAKKYVYNSAILIKNIFLNFSGTHLSTLDKKTMQFQRYYDKMFDFIPVGITLVSTVRYDNKQQDTS